MNPAINGSEPLDLQDLTPNPAAEPRTPQRSREPRSGGANPRYGAPNPAKEQIFFVENFFIAAYSLTNQKS